MLIGRRFQDPRQPPHYYQTYHARWQEGYFVLLPSRHPAVAVCNLPSYGCQGLPLYCPLYWKKTRPWNRKFVAPNVRSLPLHNGIKAVISSRMKRKLVRFICSPCLGVNHSSQCRGPMSGAPVSPNVQMQSHQLSTAHLLVTRLLPPKIKPSHPPNRTGTAP